MLCLLSGVVGFSVVRGLSTSLSVPNLAIAFAPVLAMMGIFLLHVMSATQRIGEIPNKLEVSRVSLVWGLVMVTLMAVPIALLVSFITSNLSSTNSVIAVIIGFGFVGIILLTFLRPNFGLCALLLLLPLGLILHAAVRAEHLTTDELGYLIWNPEMLLVLAAVLGISLRSLRSGDRMVLSWLTPLLLLLLLWSILSAALSAGIEEHWEGNQRSDH